MSTSESETTLLTKEQILNAPAADYMNDEQLAFFKQLLIDLHESTNVRLEETRKLMANPPEFNDESDRASWEEECSTSLRILDREQKLLPKILHSLEQIRLGEYGYCIESGEPIGIPRLLARPTAEYCAEVKAEMEMKEKAYKD